MKLIATSARDSIGYIVRIWGMDRAGQRVNAFLTVATAADAGITAQTPFSFCEERAARSAASQALGKLGTGVHFWIASIKDKALPRLLTEFKALSATHQATPAQHACPSTRRYYYG